jgi:hypothetical protein
MKPCESLIMRVPEKFVNAAASDVSQKKLLLVGLSVEDKNSIMILGGTVWQVCQSSGWQ